MGDLTSVLAGVTRLLERLLGALDTRRRDRDRKFPSRLQEAHEAARPENGHDTSKLEEILRD